MDSSPNTNIVRHIKKNVRLYYNRENKLSSVPGLVIIWTRSRAQYFIGILASLGSSPKFSNNNNNNNNNNNRYTIIFDRELVGNTFLISNMNMNGRRIFKMIQDFAYNVAENFGIYESPEVKVKDSMEGKKRISEIGDHVPIFGRPETVFDPLRSEKYLTTTTAGTVTTATASTSTETETISLFSDNYSNIRQAFKRI